MPESRAPSHFLELLLSGTLSVFLILFLGGDLSFWSANNNLPLSSRSAVLGACLVLITLLAAWAKPSRERLPQIFAVPLAFLFLSGWLTRNFSLLQGPMIRGEILLFAILPFCFWKFRRPLTLTACGVSLIALSFWLLEGAHGRLLFSDDNPTFLYRLMLLKENFPHIPFYNPLWNGGIDERAFFATGVLNVFFLFSPLIAFVDILSHYNSIVALILFALCPICTYGAARLAKLSPLGAALAAVLACSSSLLWFRWALQFGTLGFVTASSLLPLVLALGARFFKEKQVHWTLASLTLISVSLMLLWTPSGLVCIPAIGAGLVWLRTLLRQRWWLPLVILLALIHLPWITLFWSVSNVSSFLQSSKQTQSYAEAYSDSAKSEQANIENALPSDDEQPKAYKHKPKALTLKGGMKHFREAAHSAQPLLLIFLLPGLVLLSGPYRLILTATLLWLGALGSFGPLLKPQLELDRMLVIGLLLSAIPCARALEELLKAPKRNLLSSLALGFLFAGVFSVGSVAKNRTVVPLQYAGEDVIRISSTVANFAEGGRTLFSGFMLHDFGGGHVAPLPLLTGKPAIASSPIHNLWRYKQVFPKEFMRRGDEGIDEYLDLMNVSLVFAHEAHWRTYFRSRPDKFHEVTRIGSFSAFTRSSYPDSYFLEGTGKVLSQDSHSVLFSLESPDALLRFQYFPFVKVDGCNVTPTKLSKSLTFIRLTDCPTNQPLVLDSISPFERWKLGYVGGDADE